MIIKEDSEIVKAKVERKSLALKAKKESSDEECSTFGSKDEEYAMAIPDMDDLRRNEAHRALSDVSRRSTCLTPPALVPTVDKADEMILQDTLQVSLAEHKSREEQEARENVELVNKHLASVEIEKMVEGPKNELQGRYGYLFEHLRAKFLSRNLFDTLADHLQEVTVESLPTMVDNHIKEQVKKQVPEQVKVQVPVSVGNYRQNFLTIQQAIDNNIFSSLSVYILLNFCVFLRSREDPHDDAHPEGENSAKRQKTSKYEQQRDLEILLTKSMKKTVNTSLRNQ
ncbi:hypothetical protein Tco_0610657 [Tanacetum coccineum]